MFGVVNIMVEMLVFVLIVLVNSLFLSGYVVQDSCELSIGGD